MTSRSCAAATRRAPTSSRPSSTICATRSIYLKVKLRKERTLSRSRIRRRPRPDRRPPLARPRRGSRVTRIAPPSPALRRRAPPPARALRHRPRRLHDASTDVDAQRRARLRHREIPAGTEIDVRLQNALNSGTAQVEDRFEATTLVDLNVDGRTVDSGRLGDARRRHGGRTRRRAPTAPRR